MFGTAQKQAWRANVNRQIYEDLTENEEGLGIFEYQFLSVLTYDCILHGYLETSLSKDAF